jgi:RNA polymerase sigma-70 factor (ECF subfamily)
VNAYLHLDQFEDRARFSTWLTRIAIHEALARARRGRSTSGAAAMTDGADVDRCHAAAPTPEHQAFASELGRLLEAALDALPDTYRLVFILREVEGMSTAETGDCLDIAEDTVKTRLYRARALLRRELSARAGAATAEAFRFHAVRCDRIVAEVFERIHTDAARR